MDKLGYLISSYFAGLLSMALLLLLFGSKWYGRKQWNEEAFSLGQSKAWQGFFAAMIMLHHVGQKTCASWLDRRWPRMPGLELFVPIGYYFVAFFLSSNPFFILGYSATYDKLAAIADVNYVSTTGDTVYLPYMFSYRTMDENYTFTGDYLIKKNITDKQITAKVGGFGDLVDLSKYTYYAKFSGGYDEMLWYNKVAQKYTERNDDIDFIDDAAYFIIMYEIALNHRNFEQAFKSSTIQLKHLAPELKLNYEQIKQEFCKTTKTLQF